MMTPFTKVSVLVPTRRRIGYLRKLLTSFAATVADAEQAELVFRCDSDDPESIECLRQTPHRFLVGPRREGYKSLPGFFNEMAAIAVGDVLMCCNDDVEFRTPGWPQLLLDEANRYPDGVFNIGVNVGLNDDKFPFSVVSRRMVEAMGCLNDPRLLFSDIFLLDVAKAFGRAVRVNTVTVFHDWAGHGSDDTRREANRHEFDVVFKDTHGNWTDEYAARHRDVVAEAVKNVRRSGDVVAELAINDLERYRPPEAAAANGPWPPRVRCESWNSHTPPHSIHYSKQEIAEVIRALCRYGIESGEVLVTSFGNGLSSLLWGSLFDRVVAIRPGDGDQASTGKYTVVPGSTRDTRFLLGLASRFTSLRAVVLDESRYESVISPYFLMRKVLRRPAIVVFTYTAPSRTEDDGMRLFVNHLRRGLIDNLFHEIVDVERDPSGPGMSYELLD
jgi:hypothetical protein